MKFPFCVRAFCVIVMFGLAVSATGCASISPANRPALQARCDERDTRQTVRHLGHSHPARPVSATVQE